MSGNFTFPLQPTSVVSFWGGGPIFLFSPQQVSNLATHPQSTNPYQPLPSSKCPLATHYCPLFSLGTRISSLVSGLHDAAETKSADPLGQSWRGSDTRSACRQCYPLRSAHCQAQAAPSKCLPQKQKHSSSAPAFILLQLFISYTFKFIHYPCRLGCALRQIDVAAAECLKSNSGAAIQLHKSPGHWVLDDRGSHTAIELHHSHAQLEENVTKYRNIICEFV